MLILMKNFVTTKRSLVENLEENRNVKKAQKNLKKLQMNSSFKIKYERFLSIE